MKLFAYMTRSPRSTEPHQSLVSKRAIVHTFRLLNDKNQVKFLGSAFFRSEKSDKSDDDLGKDALIPLIEFGSMNGCHKIQFLIKENWKDI